MWAAAPFKVYKTDEDSRVLYSAKPVSPIDSGTFNHHSIQTLDTGPLFWLLVGDLLIGPPRMQWIGEYLLLKNTLLSNKLQQMYACQAFNERFQLYTPLVLFVFFQVIKKQWLMEYK